MNPTLAEVFRVARFGLVGGAAALIYAACLLALVHFFDVRSVVASALAYLVAIPFSFLGQKYFTFRSTGKVQQEFAGFVILQGLNLLVAMAVTYLVVDVMELGHYAGILAVIAIIALISYGAMALAIFRKL